MIVAINWSNDYMPIKLYNSTNYFKIIPEDIIPYDTDNSKILVYFFIQS